MSSEDDYLKPDGGSGGLAQSRRVFPADEPVPEGNHPICSLNVDPARLFEQSLEQTRMAIAISDPHQPDNPLVFVNRAFETLTGYGRKEVIGRNCRFLQTPQTDPRELERLRRGIEARDTIVVELENARKDGTRFVNSLHVGPIYDEGGRLTHHYGSQWDVTELIDSRLEIRRQNLVTRELRHRVGNLFGIISSVVRMSGRGETDVETVIDKASERIAALARAHEATIRSSAPGGAPADLHHLVETVLRPYREDAGGRLSVSGQVVRLPSHTVTPIGLALHELATNAVKYGAFGRENGEVRVDWRRQGDVLHLAWDEEVGAPVHPPEVDGTGRTGSGMRILRGVLRAAGSGIDYHWRETGLRIALEMPLHQADDA